MKSNLNLMICIIFTLMMGISAAENRRKSRLYLSRSRSHAPDDFDRQVLAVRRSNRTPIRPTRITFAEAKFKTSRSQQQFTADAPRKIRTWPDTAEVSSRKDYSKVNDYETNWGRIKASEDQKPDTMIGSSATFRLHISNDPAWTRLPLPQSQRERTFISPREIRTWPNSAEADWMKFYHNIVCRCEMTLGGIYGSEALRSYEIPTRSLPSTKLHTLEDSTWGQSQTHRELEFRLPPHPIRNDAVRTNSRGGHHNQVDPRRSTFGEAQASRPNNRPTKPSISFRPHTKEAPTRLEHGSPDAVIRNLA